MLHPLIQHLYAFFHALGGFGLLTLALLDSSFLFLPLADDVLLLALCADNHAKLPYYAAMATTGSVLGSWLIDWASRKGGEAALERRFSARAMGWIRAKTKRRAGVAVALASVMPPPWPFRLFVIAAAALQYPRKKLLTVIAVSRFIRFSAEGALAIVFGKQIMELGKARWVEIGIGVLIIVIVAGSAPMVVRWRKHWKETSRTARYL